MRIATRELQPRCTVTATSLFHLFAQIVTFIGTLFFLCNLFPACSGVTGSVPDSLDMKAHDDPKVSVQLPVEEAPEPGIVDRMKASMVGVAQASLQAGWGAPGASAGVGGVEVEGKTPSVEDIAIEGAPAVDVALEAPELPPAGGGVDVPGAKGSLTLPSGSVEVGEKLAV